MASAYLSVDGAPLAVPTGCGAPDHVVLEAEIVDDTRELLACRSITAADGFAVGSTGNLTLRAGERVVLGDGFSVGAGGRLALVVDPELAP